MLKVVGATLPDFGHFIRLIQATGLLGGTSVTREYNDALFFDFPRVSFKLREVVFLFGQLFL